MSSGRLVVYTYLAGDALPVSDALIRVEGSDEGVSEAHHSRFSNIDGIAVFEGLPAPARAYSTAPNPIEQPYSTYAVTVMKNGYYTKRIFEVAIFDGITTRLPVNMIVKNGSEREPEDTVDSTSSENPKL